MKVLLDTCVVSELRKETPESSVRAAVEALNEKSLYLSVITLGEIAKGVGQLPEGKKKAALQSWLIELENSFSEKILPVGLETARLWGDLTAKAQTRGKTVHACDGLIAATALEHGLHLFTRNVSDFEPTGVLVMNPWHSEE